jgi:hypothetical protein
MVTEHCHRRYHHLGHITWTAIIIGTLVALGIGFLFSLFNVGIGLYSFTMDPQMLGNIAIVGYIWLIISGIITLFIAGWVAGRIGSFSHLKRKFGILFGFSTWTLALIVTLAMTSHINSLVPSRVHIVSPPAATSGMIQTVSGPNITVNTEKVTNTIGKITLATFVLFLLSAIASCVGGYVGMRVHPEDDHFMVMPGRDHIHHEPIQNPTPPPSNKPLSGSDIP